MAHDLKGVSALVTGGARGIGRAIVELLQARGASVRIWDLLPATIDGAVAEQVDVMQPAQITAAAAAWGPDAHLDVLVNCAGYLGAVQEFAVHPAADWRRIVEVNLIGTLQVTQSLLPYLLRSGAGRIVNFGSLAGKEGLVGLAAYSAASGGVIAFSKALGRELVGRGVRVNCIAPGPIDTDMIRGLGPPVVQAMIGDSPMQRLGTAAEVAELALWLCSGASSFSTGAVFDASGGRARY